MLDMRKRPIGGAIRRVGFCAAGLASTWAIAGPAAAQAPIAPPAFEAGDVVRFELSAASNVEQGPIRFRLDQRAVMRCTADEAQGSERLFLCEFEALEISQDAGEASQRFAWSASAGAAREDDDAPPSPMEVVNAALAQSTLRVWVKREGGVARVEGYGEAAQALAQAPEAEGSIMGALAPGAAARNLAPIFGEDLPSEEEAAEAEGWSRVRSVNAGPGRTLELTTRWRVAEREGERVRLSGETSAALKQEAAPGSLAADVRVGEVEAGVETLWDAAAGRLVERRSHLRMTTSVQMGQISAQQRLNSEVQLRGLPLEEDEGEE